MWDLVAAGIRFAWRCKECRPLILNMGFTLSLAVFGFLYFSSLHNQAVAGINEQKTKTEEMFGKLSYIAGRVDDIYYRLTSTE